MIFSIQVSWWESKGSTREGERGRSQRRRGWRPTGRTMLTANSRTSTAAAPAQKGLCSSSCGDSSRLPAWSRSWTASPSKLCCACCRQPPTSESEHRMSRRRRKDCFWRSWKEHDCLRRSPIVEPSPSSCHIWSTRRQEMRRSTISSDTPPPPP
ncbi:hypothetical protein PMAYCL1PPCAC_01208, partial [Pristionchus mayeri]